MTRLEPPNDWIKRLGKEVENRTKHLVTVREKAPETLKQLQRIVDRDAYRLNDELYESSGVIEVESVDVEAFNFAVEHTRRNVRVEVALDVKNDRLNITFNPSHQSEQFQCVVDNLGGLSFFENRSLVKLDEISRRILEPIVRAEFNLDAR